jgi:hypothetical protein
MVHGVSSEKLDKRRVIFVSHRDRRHIRALAYPTRLKRLSLPLVATRRTIGAQPLNNSFFATCLHYSGCKRRCGARGMLLPTSIFDYEGLSTGPYTFSIPRSYLIHTFSCLHI